MISLEGLRVGIIGAGRSGVAAAKLLRRLGANVLLSDRERRAVALPAGIRIEQGGHTARLLKMDLLIRSPGVPSHQPLFSKIHKRKIPVISELELGSLYAHARTRVAITGTNGKTTTTTLAGELFKTRGEKTFVAGNIGTPLSDVALQSSTATTLVLEVSSYQLEDIRTFHPTISALLNVTPDHLEHHGTIAAYAAAKARIFENQTATDVCVLNADDPWCRRLAKSCRARIFWFSRRKRLSNGISCVNGNVVLDWNGKKASWSLRTQLPGPHNVENILAATAMAIAGEIDLATIRRVLALFKGVEHRLELVRSLRGVQFINDSKGTNVDSTRMALSSFTGPLIVIMGGQGKGAPYAPLKPLLRGRVDRIFVIGEDAPTIHEELHGIVPIEDVQTMARAVQRANQCAKSGDTILLSPACASFDQYRNYEERGRDFKALVRKLS